MVTIINQTILEGPETEVLGVEEINVNGDIGFEIEYQDEEGGDKKKMYLLSDDPGTAKQLKEKQYYRL